MLLPTLRPCFSTTIWQTQRFVLIHFYTWLGIKGVPRRYDQYLYTWERVMFALLVFWPYCVFRAQPGKCWDDVISSERYLCTSSQEREFVVRDFSNFCLFFFLSLGFCHFLSVFLFLISILVGINMGSKSLVLKIS